ncbi:MAG: pyridoxal-phosphate dependent enzyme, partial [Longimicrobiales bacterium]|nr:pyridoxal-phosphate dependent enzyme [Longimicrobiales bacterium]
TFDESEALALERAASEGLTYVSAYDDPWVIAGQGTLAGEVARQLGAPPSAFVVPLSGGGLIGGIAAALREDGAEGCRAPVCLAVSAERAAVMLASVQAGRPVELPEEETLANALAGGIGLDNRHSYDLVRGLVDAHATVSEEEIADAMRYAVERLRLVVEGGGAVGLAALLAHRVLEGAHTMESPPAVDGGLLPDDGPVVVILSGGNVAEETLIRVLRGRDRTPA